MLHGGYPPSRGTPPRRSVGAPRRTGLDRHVQSQLSDVSASVYSTLSMVSAPSVLASSHRSTARSLVVTSGPATLARMADRYAAKVTAMAQLGGNRRPFEAGRARRIAEGYRARLDDIQREESGLGEWCRLQAGGARNDAVDDDHHHHGTLRRLRAVDTKDVHCDFVPVPRHSYRASASLRVLVDNDGDDARPVSEVRPVSESRKPNLGETRVDSRFMEEEQQQQQNGAPQVQRDAAVSPKPISIIDPATVFLEVALDDRSEAADTSVPGDAPDHTPAARSTSPALYDTAALARLSAMVPSAPATAIAAALHDAGGNEFTAAAVLLKTVATPARAIDTMSLSPTKRSMRVRGGIKGKLVKWWARRPRIEVDAAVRAARALVRR
ncbi:hypothetical protein AMAG_13292 [Allomyces macrogynus ATCC 38327]|uniref:Uncharacterized protein n=1 Tax=Allomyces macrogynus (strain ATCC 38327) TaxID=578462 RepID=A0A0L0T044_ALLM3|nr:hypothetical protein AMAG_13292 [Allomyces macrogynus ATCC 38327]|eukprot:KNE68122.1 hypothetical protein AMAG_13292 [Allomyces macrogynus ATCC 38327]